MNTKSLEYTFTKKELAYFLFKKRSCPKCGGKMQKEKCCEILDASSAFSIKSVPLYIQGGQCKHDFYRFTCNECGYDFTLYELSK